MGKRSRCVIDICDNYIQYPELHKKHSNVDGDIITHKLPKDGAVKVAWINTILKAVENRKSSNFFHDIHAWLIN